jgi:hypothetical protein
MVTKTTTVRDFLESLPDERRADIERVRKVILDNLPKGYEELVGMGMLMYSVPLARFPDTYNGQPLCYAALASQKNYMSVYLMSVYGDKKTELWFRARFKDAGKKLDMGKSCVRFKTADDLPLDVIGETIAKVPVDTWVSLYQQARKTVKGSRPGRAAAGTRAAAAKARR